ncbi:MAG: AAA family ATPase [Lachnospiraceae bacterium]|nr:AAA family ATPase [Lachnospiraceae bacterium]
MIKKVASILIFNTFSPNTPRRRVVLFAGRSGSGKTELWRHAESLVYGCKSNRIVIADASTMAPEGWCGSNANHISDVIRDNHLADGFSHILVLDEFDKCCQPAMSSSTDYNKLFQDGLLKLFDGDTVTYGSGEKTVTLDANMITIVLCGAFSDIYELKDTIKKEKEESEVKTKRPIGFMTEPEPDTKPKEPEPEEHDGITPEDLIAYGMRSEIAGRISKIVELEPPNLETMERIGVQVTRKLSKSYGIDIAVTDGLMHEIAQKALDSGLGARYIRGQIQSRLDDLMFIDPYAHGYTLQKEPEKEKGCEMQP